MTAPVGVLAITSTPPEQVGRLAARVEELGFGELWVAEDYFFYGGFTAAATALQATTSMPVGLGLVSAVARHPAVTAMEIASLARLYPGRFTPAIGLGLPVWLNQMRLMPKSPLTAVRECVSGVRSLLAGETVSNEGEYFGFRDISLVHPPPDADLPIYLGSMGPNMLRLAGEIGDGCLLSALASPEYVRWARKLVAEGAGVGAGRPTPRLPVFVLVSVDRDGAKARAQLRPIVAFYLAAFGPSALTAAYGDSSSELAAMIEAGGAEVIAAEMPDAWMEDFVIAGAPDECVAKVARYLEAGADSVVVSALPPENAPEMLELIAREVLPRL